MAIVRALLGVIKCLLLVLLGYILFVQVVVRIIRRFYQFPIPSFVARLIDNPVRRLIQPADKVVAWMGVKPGMSMLEIGPGPGTFTFEAADLVGETGQVFAIDIQESIISSLKKKIEQKGISNVIPEQASAYELPYLDGYFDRVYLIAVLGEIPDKQRALTEFRRVLKDDGCLAIGEFLPDPDYPRKTTVTTLCKEAGFEMVESFGNIIHYLLLFTKA